MSFDINQVRFNRIGDARSAYPRKFDSALPGGGAKEQASAGVVVEAGQALVEPGPPIDSERVREIRDALRSGTYPLSPSKVADAMIAARYMLSDS